MMLICCGMDMLDREFGKCHIVCVKMRPHFDLLNTEKYYIYLSILCYVIRKSI